MRYSTADISSVPLRHVSWYKTEQVCNLQQLHWHSKALYCANCISLLWSSLDGWRQAVGGCRWPGSMEWRFMIKWNENSRAHLQEQWKKVAPQTINTALTDWLTDLQTDWLCHVLRTCYVYISTVVNALRSKLMAKASPGYIEFHTTPYQPKIRQSIESNKNYIRTPLARKLCNYNVQPAFCILCM